MKIKKKLPGILQEVRKDCSFKGLNIRRNKREKHGGKNCMIPHTVLSFYAFIYSSSLSYSSFI